MPYPFHGVYPVLYAFWDRAGRLDREAMRLQVEHCITAGAHGLMVLGLVTEVNKMDSAERRETVELVGALNAGRVPYAVTVAEPSAESQIAFARGARAAGADFVILQPPPARGGGEAELIRFFGRVADALDCPVAIQHNPFNLDVWLSIEGMTALHRNHPNVTVLKGEGTAVETETLVAATGGKLAVFGGHGGIEYLSVLRAGAAGLIPAPDCLAPQVRIYELFRESTPESLAEAERLHRELLPLIVFMIRSFPALLCYGKRFMARRIGVEQLFDRAPAIRPTPFGLAEMDRLFEALRATEASMAKRAREGLSMTSDDDLFGIIRTRLFTAVLGDVMDAAGLTRQFLPPAIRALQPDMMVVGRAMPVLEADCASEIVGHSGRAEPFGLAFRALDDLKPGEVYICTGSSLRYALWGELMSTRARTLGAAGAVLDGYHRDTRGVLNVGLPVFSQGAYAQDQRLRGRVVDYRCEIEFANGARVAPGDLIVGDIDGVLTIPRARVEDIVRAALAKVEGEESVRQMIERGERTQDIFDKTGIM